MAKKKQEEESCGNWMDTYGDMVTLLLTFFVLLYSMADVNQEKYAQFVKAFTSKDPDSVNIILDQSGQNQGGDHAANRTDSPDAVAGQLANASLDEMQEMTPDSFNDLYEYLKAYVEKSGMESSVIITEGEGSVFIRFENSIFFNPDSSVLKTESYPLLDFIGNCLTSVEDEIMTVDINGHTADPKVSGYHVSDWKLSSERAANVAIYLEEEQGFEPSKLLPIGYGKNFPIADNNTPEGREKNRRVDMLIISNDSTMSADDILDTILNGTFDLSAQQGTGGVEEILYPDGTSEAQQSSSSGSNTLQQNSSMPKPEPVEQQEPEMTSPYEDD